MRIDKRRTIGKRFLAATLLLWIGSNIYGCKNSVVNVPATAEQTKEIIKEVSLETLAAAETVKEEPNTTGTKILNGNSPYFVERETECFEEYGALDSLGRCTVAFACIGKELMPTEARGEIGQIKPTGWKQNKYPGIIGTEPPYLYNRCHLIAFCLTGENANECNLITGTRWLNEAMLPYEIEIADYLDHHPNNHVMYRVTPIFEEDNLLATSVMLEAASVEDNAIEFCVLLDNMQPGIQINYKDGSNSLAQ